MKTEMNYSELVKLQRCLLLSTEDLLGKYANAFGCLQNEIGCMVEKDLSNLPRPVLETEDDKKAYIYLLKEVSSKLSCAAFGKEDISCERKAEETDDEYKNRYVPFVEELVKNKYESVLSEITKEVEKWKAPSVVKKEQEKSRAKLSKDIEKLKNDAKKKTTETNEEKKTA